MTAWPDALAAARLLAADPGLGGLTVRAWPGPARDRLLAELRGALPDGAPWRRLPAAIGDDRLLGGLDLAATLAAGRPVEQRGLLAEAQGGIVVLPMAERAPPALAARLAAALDGGGLAMVSLDEGGPDEAPHAMLLDRLAFHIDLADADVDRPDPLGDHPGEPVETLVAVADALGVASARAAVLAIRAARVAAELAGRAEPDAADIALAARLVLAPRATRLPAPAESPPESQPDVQERTEAESATDDGSPRALADVVLDSARAAIPPGLLASMALAGAARRAAAGAGATVASAKRGRPVGTRAGDLRQARLDLIQTLRAAAPWQRLRERDGPVKIRAGDIRVRRFRQRTRATTIFAVDASGSAALHRLAEAKGAVELVLAECYVRRDQVALIAFRGSRAELILPPTGSLARARRALAGLPGGGATPLATALDAAALLADQLRRRGQTPVVVVLSDGRANVARDGTQGRPQAEADALAAAALIRAQGIAALLVDTSPRPSAAARAVAEAMGARYLPLPYADARAVSRAVADAA